MFLDPGAAWGAGGPVDNSRTFLHHFIPVLWGMSFLWVVFSSVLRKFPPAGTLRPVYSGLFFLVGGFLLSFFNIRIQDG